MIQFTRQYIVSVRPILARAVGLSVHDQQTVSQSTVGLKPARDIWFLFGFLFRDTFAIYAPTLHGWSLVMATAVAATSNMIRIRFESVICSWSWSRCKLWPSLIDSHDRQIERNKPVLLKQVRKQLVWSHCLQHITATTKVHLHCLLVSISWNLLQNACSCNNITGLAALFVLWIALFLASPS